MSILRGRRAVAIGAVVAAAVAAIAVVVSDDRGADNPGGEPPSAEEARPESIVSYLEREEGGHVLVPAGRYTGGLVDTSHSDWLVLEAEDPDQVVVDLAETGLQLDEGTRRVVFVGFRFVNGMVRLAGVEDVHFWYCEFTFPAEEWFRQYEAAGGSADEERSARSRLIADLPNPLPSAIRTRAGIRNGRKNARIGVYGSDLHHVGDDGVFLGSVDGARLEGLRIWNIDEAGFDPGARHGIRGDWFHNDSIQAVPPTSEVTVADSWLGQKLQWGASNGAISDARFERLWIAGSRTFGMLATVRNGGRILNSTLRDIRAFANGQAGGTYDLQRDAFRTDVVNGKQLGIWPEQHHDRGAFELNASGVTTQVPAGITIRDGLLVDINQLRDHPDNPANQWRTAHPYDTWARYLRLGARFRPGGRSSARG